MIELKRHAKVIAPITTNGRTTDQLCRLTRAFDAKSWYVQRMVKSSGNFGTRRYLVSIADMKPVPLLVEISAMLSYNVVLLATSVEDAKEHVATWETCWATSSDFVGVSDVDVFDTRDLRATNWEDEAHEMTSAARALIAPGDFRPGKPIKPGTETVPVETLRWTACQDEMPTDGESVLAFNPDWGQTDLCYREGSTWHNREGFTLTKQTGYSSPPTHWTKWPKGPIRQ